MIKKNKSFIFLVTRYITYGFQFISAFLIAVKLGPYYMGLWAFFGLISQYLTQINFGIPQSFNILLSGRKVSQQLSEDRIMSNTLMLVGVHIGLILLVMLFHLIWFPFIFSKFSFFDYSWKLLLGACFIQINAIYVAYYRIKDRLNYVAYSQTVPVIANLIALYFFKGEALFHALVNINVCSQACICLIFTILKPLRVRINFLSLKIVKIIFGKSGYLFLYNSCYYLIMVVTRTIVSKFYRVEEFGTFSFVFSLSQAVVLLLETISFIVFPVIIYTLRHSSKNVIETKVKALRSIFVTLEMLSILSSVAFFALVSKYIPKYVGTEKLYGLFSAQLLLIANNFGWSNFLMAKSKERQLSFVAFLSLVAALVNSVIVAKLGVSIHLFSLSTIATYLFFNVLIYYYYSKNLGNRRSISDHIFNYLNYKIWLPLLCLIVISSSPLPSVLLVLPVFLYLIINFAAIKDFLNVKERYAAITSRSL